MISSRLLVVPDPADRASAAKAREELAPALPDGLAEVPPRTETASSASGSGIATVLLAWPRRYVEGEFDAGYGAMVLAPEVASEPEALRTAWREWLGLFNELQVLPNTFLMTRDGIAHGDYGGLGPRGVGPGAELSASGSVSASWEARVGEAVEGVRDGMRSLAGRGVPPPDAVGAELEHEGVVRAEAELQWTERRLVVLTAHQADGADMWTDAGWQVVPVSDADWANKAAETLSRGSAV